MTIDGGNEVNLGIWNDWTNFINNETKYHTMLYDRGDNCMHYQRFTYVSCFSSFKLRFTSLV